MELPHPVHLLTLALLPETQQLLLRLEHRYAPDEEGSMPVELSLADLISSYGLGTVTHVEETMLGANQAKRDHQGWMRNQVKAPLDKQLQAMDAPSFNITLQPFEIKTFILTTQKTQE